jgi:hypothetical protein
MMRTSIIASLFLVVAGVVVLVATRFRAPEVSLRDQTASIAVSPIRSDVLLKTSSVFAPLPGPSLAPSGSVVRTSETGRALIETSEGHVSVVDPRSEVVLSQVEASSAIEIVAGSVWSRLENTLEQGEFELRTKTAAAVVRGTSFGMEAGLGGPTTVLVSEGSVACYVRDLATGERVEESEVVATAGTKAIWQSDGKIVVTPLSEGDRASEWYRYHNGISSSTKPATIQKPPAKTEPKTPTATGEVPPAKSPEPVPVEEPLPAFILSSITPKEVVVDGTSIVRIQGTGFTKAITVTVGGAKVHQWSIQGEREIRITIDASMPGGTYDVTVVDTYGRTITLPKSLTVREAPKKEELPAGRNSSSYPYRTQ